MRTKQKSESSNLLGYEAFMANHDMVPFAYITNDLLQLQMRYDHKHCRGTFNQGNVYVKYFLILFSSSGLA
jgi:hypothetical protein